MTLLIKVAKCEVEAHRSSKVRFGEGCLALLFAVIAVQNQAAARDLRRERPDRRTGQLALLVGEFKTKGSATLDCLPNYNG